MDVNFLYRLVALSAPGALDLMAIRLLVLESLCLIGLFVVKRKPVWSAVSIFYLLYIAWLLIGLSYSPAPSYGFRIILKYLYAPSIRFSGVFKNSSISVPIVYYAVCFGCGT